MTDTERFEEALQRLVASVRDVLEDDATIVTSEVTEMEAAFENYMDVIKDLYGTEEQA